MHTTTLILFLLGSLVGCTSAPPPGGSSTPREPLPAMDQVRGIFAESAADVPSELGRPPRRRPGCTDGTCALPRPAPAATDAFAVVPEGVERPVGLLVPAGGAVSRRSFPAARLFGRAWERDRRIRGLGIGVEATLCRSWRAGAEIGFDSRAGAAVAAALSRRF